MPHARSPISDERRHRILPSPGSHLCDQLMLDEHHRGEGPGRVRPAPDGRAYYLLKIAAGKTRREAMRCLKRRISDALYRRLVTDARADVEAGPGGHRGASQQSSAAGSHPHTGTSDQPLPGPAPTTLPAATPARKGTSAEVLQTVS